MLDTKLKKGDRVELVSDEFGHLKAGSTGIVAEVYEASPSIGVLPFPPMPPTNETFDAAVVWPTLRATMPAEARGLVIEGLDYSNLHEGDVIPMKAHELKVVGNIYADGPEAFTA